MQKQKYNGWTNYETWNYKLWLDNDEPSYRAMRKLAKKHKDAYDLSAELSDLAHNNAPLLEPSFYSDIMTASIREVNFFEIAESYLDEVKEVA
tara:strand:+ start:294 stop:572 length:279 start_codon:yes stop_codon:yes gene_type:complete